MSSRKSVRLEFLVTHFTLDVYWSFLITSRKQPLLSTSFASSFDVTVFLSSGSKPSGGGGGGGGGDWLGLGGGDDDGGLDLNEVPLKTNTPFPRESAKDSPSTQGTCMFFLSLLQVACVTFLFPFLFVFHNPLTLCHFSEFSSPGTSREASVTAKKGRPTPGGR